MRRRAFLATGSAVLAVGLAGCAHPDVVLDLESATDAAIADEVALHVDSEDEEHTVLSEAIENGTATRQGRYELFDPNETVRVNETFYTVSETELAREGEVTVYAVALDLDPADTTPELGAIDFTDLPAADQERLEPLVTLESPPNGDGSDVGVDYGSLEAVDGDSVFVPDQQYDILVHEGERYRVAVESRTVPEGTYEYAVTEIAGSVSAFADGIRDAYLFTLSGLSEDERAVVEEAIDSAYFEDDEAFQSVVEQIREHEGLSEDDFWGTWLLEYEGEGYLAYVEW